MPRRSPTEANPKEAGVKPPFREPMQKPPGAEREMRTRPDHGEESYTGLNRLRDKVALITGADSGIGKAVAIAYAREGADVAFTYLAEQEDKDAEETTRWVKQAGRRSLQVRGDIGDENFCKHTVDWVLREFGRLDILVNNAAFQMTHQKIEEFSGEEWDRTFRTNIYAMFYLAKAALPRMEQGGAIINTASVQAYQPNGQLLAYATTKGAIVTFTKALSQLALARGVRVNAVAPGPVWTPLISSSMQPGKVEKFGQTNPMERPAQPAELAPAYVFLASQQESSFVTGSVLDLTGGEMLP
jgi:NAD(P)-dependent dehydrogenase (short-subunit alcohol dehydrogenase family)